jgi:tRNA(Arg) A34 adenosine deaminase TadA
LRFEAKSDHRHFGRHLKHALDILTSTDLNDELTAFHAAIIVQGGNVMSVGRNKPYATGFVRAYAHHDWCGEHAEINAISRCRRKTDLTGSKIYVAKLNRLGVIGNSKPCCMCESAIRSYGLKRVYYTLDESTFACMKL